jgi:hypothetical protein
MDQSPVQQVAAEISDVTETNFGCTKFQAGLAKITIRTGRLGDSDF